MILLQKFPKHCSTSGEISDYILMKILSTMQKIVFFVTDRYLESSTKTLKRKESFSGAIRNKVKRREQKRPNQFVKFLRNPGIKMSLVKFLLNDWKKKQANSFQGKQIYAKCDNKGFHIFENNGIIQIDEFHDISSGRS